jgi:hypothetical protein
VFLRLTRFNAEQREESYFVLLHVLLVAAGRESAREPQQKAVKQRISWDPVHPTKRLLTGFGGPWRAFWRYSPVKISLCALRVLTHTSSSTSYIAVALATSQDQSYRPTVALSPDGVTFNNTIMVPAFRCQRPDRHNEQIVSTLWHG